MVKASRFSFIVSSCAAPLFSPLNFQSSQMQAGNEHKKEKKRAANMIPLMIANNNGLTYEGLGIAFSPVIRYAFDIPLLRKNSYMGGLVQVQCLQCREGVCLAPHVKLHHIHETLPTGFLSYPSTLKTEQAPVQCRRISTRMYGIISTR
jgi:hypothetical protein